MQKKPCILIIRDGWGINPGGSDNALKNGDATLLADTPFHDYIFDKYPVSKVSASGEDVGLPSGQMGNSEVGHLNLGAGRIVYQDLSRINKAIENGESIAITPDGMPAIPVNAEPSPARAVAVKVPVTVTPPVTVSSFLPLS